MAESKLKPYVTLFAGVLAVSFAAVFIRLAEAPPLVIAAYRLTIAAVILIPVAAVRSGSSLKKLSRRDVFLVLLSSVFVALHFGLWITSLSYTSIASAVVLVTCHPVFVAAFSYFLWDERLGKVTTGGIIVALSGVIFINYSGFTFSSEAIIGNSLALAAGFFMGAYLLIGGQLRARIDLLTYLTLIYSAAAIILLIAAASLGYSFIGYSPTTYVMMGLLALVPQLVGHSLLNLAVRLIPVTLVSVAIIGEPIGATILGYFILGEMPTVSEVAGGLLILTGIFMVMGRTPKRLVVK